jgi:phage shock protein A
MFDRIKNLMGAMVNNGVNKLETPELLLEQAEMELQKNLKDLKEALTESIAGEKMTEIQLQKKAQELTDWENEQRLLFNITMMKWRPSALRRSKRLTRPINL